MQNYENNEYKKELVIRFVNIYYSVLDGHNKIGIDKNSLISLKNDETYCDETGIILWNYLQNNNLQYDREEIKTLKLNSLQISYYSSLKTIIEYIKSLKNTFEHLDISDNFLGDAGLIELIKELKNHKFLKSLNVSNNYISEHTLKFLTNLPINLIFDGNCITEEVVKLLNSKYVKYFYVEEFFANEKKSPKTAVQIEISDNIKILCGIESWCGIIYNITDINDIKLESRNIDRRICGYFYNFEGKIIYEFNRFPRRFDHVVSSIEYYVETLHLLSNGLKNCGYGTPVDDGKIKAVIGREEGYYEGLRKQILQMELSPEKLEEEIVKTLKLPGNTDIANISLSKLHSIEEAEFELHDSSISLTPIDFYVLNPEYDFYPYEEPGIMIECELSDENVEKILSLAIKWKQDRISIESYVGVVNFEILF